MQIVSFLSKMLATVVCFVVGVGSAVALEREPNLGDTAVGDPALVEREFSKTPNGSVIDGIVFRKRYIAAAPQEDCIVLTFPRLENGSTYLTAVTLYTKGGVVIAHLAKGENRRIDSLKPSDLISGDLTRLRKSVAEFAVENTQTTNNYSIFETLKTLTRVEPDKPEICGFIGASVSTIEGKPTLSFDWMGYHLFFTPNEGVKSVQLPTDAVTGEPYVGLQGADFLELVLFGLDYQRLYPTERVEIIYNLEAYNHHTHALPEKDRKPITYPCAAYTKGGKLYLFSTILGHFLADGFSPANITENDRLRAYYIAELKNKGVQSYDFKTRTSATAPNAIVGDGPAMPLYRAYARLQKYYNECELRDYIISMQLGNLYPHSNTRHLPSIVFQWQRGLYVYTITNSAVAEPQTQALFEGMNEPMNKNRLVEGICIVTDWRSKHPNETAIMVPYLLKGQKLKTAVLWTDNGKLYGYNNDSWEAMVIPYGNLEDIKNPAKYGVLAQACDMRVQATKLEGHQKIRERAEASSGKPWDGSAYTVASIAARLRSKGIVVHSNPTTKERFPDGSVKESPVPSALIEWAGTTYTYGPDLACVHSNGVILRN